MCWFSLSFSSQKRNRSVAIVPWSSRRRSFQFRLRSSIPYRVEETQNVCTLSPPRRRLWGDSLLSSGPQLANTTWDFDPHWPREGADARGQTRAVTGAIGWTCACHCDVRREGDAQYRRLAGLRQSYRGGG